MDRTHGHHTDIGRFYADIPLRFGTKSSTSKLENRAAFALYFKQNVNFMYNLTRDPTTAYLLSLCGTPRFLLSWPWRWSSDDAYFLYVSIARSAIRTLVNSSSSTTGSPLYSPLAFYLQPGGRVRSASS